MLGLAAGLCVCGSAGVVVWLPVPEGLWVCAGAVPEGDVLSGVVLWAATQHADSSNKANKVALDFIRIRRLRGGFIHSLTVGVLEYAGNPAEPLSGWFVYRTAKLRVEGKNYR